MQKIRFVNSAGDAVEMGSNFPIMVSNIMGIGSAAAVNASEKGFEQDGDSYYSTLLDARLISFDVYMQGENARDLADKRNEMMRVFNPKLGIGTLFYYESSEGEEISARRIDVVTDGEIIYGEKLNSVTQKFSITMLANNPAFMSIEEYQSKMVGFVGGMKLPLEMPFILASQGDEVEIEYEGDVDAPLLIEFRGAASMPKIEKKETGEVIEVEVDINAGESLFIDTSQFDVDVYKIVNGEKVNANNYVKVTSDFFLLTRGINTLTFDAAGGDPEVYIKYRERYLGC